MRAPRRRLDRDGGRVIAAAAALLALGSAGCGALLDFEDNYYIAEQIQEPSCTGRCPRNLLGPPLVEFEGYCIDSTEVTVGQYEPFHGDQDYMPAWPESCETATTSPDTTTSTYYAAGAERATLPVTAVSWCAAWAYCAWAGKRLCGSIPNHGAPNDYDAYADPINSQWYNACSQHGTQVYPYGSTYVEATCNDGNGAVPVGTAGGGACRGVEKPQSCIFDMSGNAMEWEDSCNGEASGNACRLRGGSWNSGASDLRCAANEALGRLSLHREIGFRCCLDL